MKAILVLLTSNIPRILPPSEIMKIAWACRIYVYSNSHQRNCQGWGAVSPKVNERGWRPWLLHRRRGHRSKRICSQGMMDDMPVILCSDVWFLQRFCFSVSNSARYRRRLGLDGTLLGTVHFQVFTCRTRGSFFSIGESPIYPYLLNSVFYFFRRWRLYFFTSADWTPVKYSRKQGVHGRDYVRILQCTRTLHCCSGNVE